MPRPYTFVPFGTSDYWVHVKNNYWWIHRTFDDRTTRASFNENDYRKLKDHYRRGMTAYHEYIQKTFSFV